MLQQQQYYSIYVYISSASNSGSGGRQISDLVDQSISINSLCFLVTADNHYILACGFWDNSFRVYSSETGAQNPTIFTSHLSIRTLTLNTIQKHSTLYSDLTHCTVILHTVQLHYSLYSNITNCTVTLNTVKHNYTLYSNITHRTV